MRLLAQGVVGADPRCKKTCKPEVAEMRGDPIAVAAGNEPKTMMASDSCQDTACPCYQLGFVLSILLAPGEVGSVPADPRKFRGAIDVVPIGRIVSSEFVESPGNAHLPEHGKVRAGIGVERVEKSAVPIEENAFDRMFFVYRHRMKRVAENFARDR